jgi:proteic killer suppression protein
MKIEFEKEYLRELYEEGKASGKKYRFQPQVIKQYIKTVDLLKNAPNTEFLYKFKSLSYEKKVGDLKGIEAVYVNLQFRIEFTSRIEGEEPDIVTICSLTELSNHYKK